MSAVFEDYFLTNAMEFVNFAYFYDPVPSTTLRTIADFLGRSPYLQFLELYAEEVPDLENDEILVRINEVGCHQKIAQTPMPLTARHLCSPMDHLLTTYCFGMKMAAIRRTRAENTKAATTQATMNFVFRDYKDLVQNGW